MKIGIGVGIAGILLLFAVGQLYVKDSATVEQAIVVDEYFKRYCSAHNSYPDSRVLEAEFPELYSGQEWYYWPNETLTVASFQYPLTLPIVSAPGRSKFSEFFPIIYSYVVQDPCKHLIR